MYRVFSSSSLKLVLHLIQEPESRRLKLVIFGYFSRFPLETIQLLKHKTSYSLQNMIPPIRAGIITKQTASPSFVGPDCTCIGIYKDVAAPGISVDVGSISALVCVGDALVCVKDALVCIGDVPVAVEFSG